MPTESFPLAAYQGVPIRAAHVATMCIYHVCTGSSAYCSRPIAIAEPRTNVYLGTYLPHCLQRCAPIVHCTYTTRRINNAAHAYALNLHVRFYIDATVRWHRRKKQFLNARCRPASIYVNRVIVLASTRIYSNRVDVSRREITIKYKN